MKAGLDTFKYSEDEKNAIEVALNDEHPWESALVVDIKRRIKDFHLTIGGELCCYCYRDLTGEFLMAIDIEHILPKRHYKQLTFDIRNLSVACKRCNMKIKRDRLDFLSSPVATTEIEETTKYRIIHPNIDDRNSHLQRISIQVSTERIVKYITISDSSKGKFSYQYFKLRDFELDSYDNAQGASQNGGAEFAAIEAIRALVKAIE